MVNVVVSGKCFKRFSRICRGERDVQLGVFRAYAEYLIRLMVMRGNVCLFYVKDKNMNKINLWTLHRNRSV